MGILETILAWFCAIEWHGPFKKSLRLLVQSSEDGALPQLFCITVKEI